MRALFLLLFPLLCACATPSPPMAGALRHDVRQDGLDFAVFHKDDQAEVVRLTFMPRPSRARVHGAMARAAARATGCAVIPFSMTVRLPGDTGVASFDLDCRDGLSPDPGS